jgi:hypothetical protein
MNTNHFILLIVYACSGVAVANQQLLKLAGTAGVHGGKSVCSLTLYYYFIRILGVSC